MLDFSLTQLLLMLLVGSAGSYCMNKVLIEFENDSLKRTKKGLLNPQIEGWFLWINMILRMPFLVLLYAAPILMIRYWVLKVFLFMA